MSNTTRYAHDHAPDCPTCETDVFVGRREGCAQAWHCWHCGEIFDV